MEIHEERNRWIKTRLKNSDLRERAKLTGGKKDRLPETQKIGSQDLEQSLLGAGEVLQCAANDKAR